VIAEVLEHGRQVSGFHGEGREGETDVRKAQDLNFNVKQSRPDWTFRPMERSTTLLQLSPQLVLVYTIHTTPLHDIFPPPSTAPLVDLDIHAVHALMRSV